MLPPGPPLPPAAQLAAWIYEPARFFLACQRRYGDVFTMRLPGAPPRVMLARHEDIRAVFSADPARLHAGPANALVEPLVGPRSVLLLDGAEHLRERRRLLALFNARSAVAHGDTMRALTDAMVDAWPVGVPFSLRDAMQSLTLRIIVATLFGATAGPEGDALVRTLEGLLDLAQRPLLLVPALRRDLGALTPWKAFRAHLDALDALLAPRCEARRRALDASPDDADDVLAQLVGATEADGRRRSDRDVRDELVTLLVAGHETTANALAWTFAHALDRPTVCERIVQEVNEVTGGAPVRAAHLDGLTYTGAVIAEAMRLDPVLAHVGRQLTEPFTVGAWTLPAGAMVVPCIWLAHRDARVFPEPERFAPERFLEGRTSPHAYLPFGGGARRCLGMSFALQEMKIVLATVLRRASLARVAPGRPRVTRRGVVWSPAGGVAVVQRRPPRPPADGGVT